MNKKVTGTKIYSLMDYTKFITREDLNKEIDKIIK